MLIENLENANFFFCLDKISSTSSNKPSDKDDYRSHLHFDLAKSELTHQGKKKATFGFPTSQR